MNNNKQKPLVSIGIPVFNEGKYLDETLESLLSQTYQNMEIIISDNASTDSTQEICKKYSEKYYRIRYVRSEKNIGEINNFNKLVGLAKGKYFMWAGAHDLWDEEFIEKCVGRLEKNSDCVACYSFKEHINASGDSIKRIKRRFETKNLPRFLRFMKSIWVLYTTSTFGVIRRRVLDKTRLVSYVIGPDHVLRVELSLYGEFLQIPEILAYFRHNRIEDQSQALQRRLSNWRKTSNMSWFYLKLPHWAMVYEFGKGGWFNSKNIFRKVIYFTIGIVVGGLRFSRVLFLDLLRLIKNIIFIRKHGESQK